MGKYYGHSSADNMEIRYADRHIDEYNDLIYGVSLNNNPSLPDPWNTAGAWMQYVPVPSPTSSSFIDGNTPYPGLAAGGNIAGITAYGYWNQLLYVEFGGYGTANGLTSFMSAGVPDDEKTQLQGTNPYWRVALSHFWGANNIMVGTSGMSADVYDDPLDSWTRTAPTISRISASIPSTSICSILTVLLRNWPTCATSTATLGSLPTSPWRM